MTKTPEKSIEKKLKLSVIQNNPIKLNGLVVDFNINKNQIKINLNDEIEIEKNSEIEFDYEGITYKVKVNVLDLGVVETKELIDSYINEGRVIEVNEYGRLTNRDSELMVNITKLNKNKIYFNVLKKDENLIYNALESEALINFKINEKNIKIKVSPVIENISEKDDIMLYSEIEIKENKEEFEKYLEKENNKQNKKEKKILIDNLIKEIY